MGICLLITLALTSPHAAARAVPKQAPTAAAPAPTPAPVTAPQAQAPVPARAPVRPEEFIFTVFTSTAPGAPKSAYATGFVVVRSGVIATSYRAVSPAAQNPRKYHIYVDLRGAVSEARLVAVDLPHDLALVSIDHGFTGEFSLSTRPLNDAEQLTSFGLSIDSQAPSTVSQELQGVRHVGVWEQLALSAPLQPWFAGGPLLNAQGEVAGANVAFTAAGRVTTFATSSAHIYNLIQATHSRAPASEAQWSVTAAGQIADAAEAVSRAWLDSGLRAEPAGLKCWNETSSASGHAIERCQSTLAITPERGLDLATIQVERVHFSGAPPTPTTLDHIYRETSQEALGDFFNQASRQDRHRLTLNKCTERVVVNARGSTFKVGFCSAAYARYQGLFDNVFKIAPAGRAPAGQVISVRMNGFRPEQVKDALRAMLDSAERN